MKKKLIFFTILLFAAFFNIKETYAFSKADYANRTLCGGAELALFKADGTIETISCHNNFDEAKAAMVENGHPDLGIFININNEVKLIDANAALVDFTASTSTFNIYPDSQIVDKTEHTYMTGASAYGGGDGAFLTTGYSHYANTFTFLIKINGYTGWVRAGTAEIVPLVWVRSSSSYTISNDSIRHNYVTKIQEDYYGSSGRTIGPKPENIAVGTYYSYDGHYFYTDRYAMVSDFKAGHYNNSINPTTPYYNYYQFLPQHTRTTYSSINIDEYIRNVLGYGRDVYGTTALNKDGIETSRFYGQGTFFYYAQEIYGANALLSFGVSRNETGNGRSNFAINKNNGFGLDAVDSNPNAADVFPLFSQSIIDYANSWVTYGYSEPTDWRYNGAQNGNKSVGMNVRYASDVYWGEKMASYYYSLDKALGLQDYNFYQTAVTTRATTAMSAPSTSAKAVFNYTSADNGLVILDEVQGDAVDGNTTWYKVVSDMNIDANFNQITSGYYNWNSYVYVPAVHVLKTNEGKNGYISPNEVTEYQDKGYTYDIYQSTGILQPKVAISTKETMYYYDPTLQSAKGQSLLKNRYVMVYATAYDQNKLPVAYLVTSDYKYSQKHWVSADSIKFVTCRYGQASVTVSGTNTYSLVNPTTVDSLANHISGLYHYAYTPILEETVVDGKVWFKVPVDLSGNNQEFGWTLQSDTDVYIATYQYTAENTSPVLTATDKEITQGKEFNPLTDVTATDAEDGNITSSIKVTTNEVNTDVPGTYKVTYEVTDAYGDTVTITINVTVLADEEPVINVSDKTISLGNDFDPKTGVTATDAEDGTITDKIKVIKNTVNSKELGTYEVTYQVTDSYNHAVEKTIKVTVAEIIKEKKDAAFFLDYLKEENGTLQIKGYNSIKGIDNDLNTAITYKIIYENLSTREKYTQELTRITKKEEISRPVYSDDNKDYTYSWYKGKLDIDDLPDGDYKLYVISESDKYYSETVISNKVLRTQVATFESEKTVTTRNNYFDSDLALELIIRDKKIADKTASSIYNEYNQYRTLEFKNNKLHIMGTSYSIGMDLSKNATIERKIIFEETTTFKKYEYNLGSVSNGLYEVGTTLGDNLSKTQAWFDATIDITNIPKGEYAIYITTEANVADYSELNELLFRSLDSVVLEVNDLKYSFRINEGLRYRIELLVE